MKIATKIQISIFTTKNKNDQVNFHNYIIKPKLYSKDAYLHKLKCEIYLPL